MIGVASMSAIPKVTQPLPDYIARLTIGQGRYAGQPFKLLGWQRRLLSGAFRQPDDAALSMGRGGGKSTFTAAIACAAVDVGGPLVEPMAECLVVASSFDQGLGELPAHAQFSHAVIRAIFGNARAAPYSRFGEPGDDRRS